MALSMMGQELGTLKWSYQTSGEIYSSPAIDLDGSVYIGVNDETDDGINDNAVVALNSDGSLKWKAEATDWVESTPAIGPNGVLYVGTWDGFLYALDTETGAEIWKFETFGVIDSSVAIGEDGVLYFGNGENALYAINPDGTPTWVREFNTSNADPFRFDDWVDSSPTIDFNGNIWAADLFGNLKQISPDRTEVWSIDLGVGMLSSPAIAQDGTVYIGDEDGLVLAITPGLSIENENQPKWVFDTGSEGIESSPVIGMDGTVYIGTGDGDLYAFDGQTGQVKAGWPFTGSADVIYSTPAITENGTVYVGSGDTKLYAVSNAGNLLWSFDTDGFVDSSPAIGPDGTVYFGSTDGKVYAVHGGSPLGFSRWPKFRGNAAANGKVDPYRKWVEDLALAEPNPFSDPDNDGCENVLEWAFGTDPEEENLIKMHYLMISSSFGTANLDARWLVEARGMLIDFSDDLETWESLDLNSPESYSWLNAISLEEVEDKLEVQLDLDPSDSSPRFFRLKGLQN
ncbi:MAG: hypothetical protein CMI18_03705 [Opitutaceae bacterium]|nr:hypothetical protein [Opitutaceae bacterium]